MGKHGCYDGVLDTSGYHTPLPAIGVYIAVASLVCFISVTFDLWYGLFYRKHHWLPSKLFSLNSFTLTIIAVATKLAVDLNSPMPRAIDQLSKLTATVLLCLSLGLFVPSVGAMRKSECFANLAALSVVVITVVVNICMQLSTGVIFAFIAEQVIIMVFMLLLLILLWSSSSNFTPLKSSTDVMRNIRTCCRRHMAEELNGLSELHKKINVQTPLFTHCHNPNCSTASLLCSLATLVILEATIRTIRSMIVKEPKFCSEASDYRWSIWGVVVVQLLTIVISSFTIGFRWLIVISHRSLDWYTSLKNVFDVYDFWLHRIRLWRYESLPFDFHNEGFMNFMKESKDLIAVVLTKLQMCVIMTSQLVEFLCLMLRKSFKMCRCRNDGEMERNSNDRTYEDKELRKWIESNIEVDANRWLKFYKHDIPNNLRQILSKTFDQSVQPLSFHYESNGTNHHYKFSSLSLVVLMEIANTSLPIDRASFLSMVLKEAIEIVFFVEKNDPDCHYHRHALLHAKMLYKNRKSASTHATGSDRVADDINQSLDKIRTLLEIHFKTNVIDDVEFRIICQCILSRTYASIDQLSDCIERTFRAIVIDRLVQLPRAILAEYDNCPLIDSDERTTRGLKFFCKWELVTDTIPWFLPNPTNTPSQQPRQDTRVVNSDNASTSTTNANNVAEEESTSAAVCTTADNLEEGSSPAATVAAQGHEITEQIRPEEIV